MDLNENSNEYKNKIIPQTWNSHNKAIPQTWNSHNNELTNNQIIEDHQDSDIDLSSFLNNGICSNSYNNDLTNNQIIDDSSVSSSSEDGNFINSEYEMNESVNNFT